MSTRATIIWAALLSEGILVALAYGIFWGTTLAPNFSAAPSEIVIGAAAALPLLALNHLLWLWSLQHPASIFARFSREVIVPLCSRMTPAMALFVAVLSGFAEELFFRGAVNQVLNQAGGPLLAATVSSALFAYVHFIGNLKRFGGMLPLYTGVGLYLWCVVEATGSLCAGMITHGLYNFLAIQVIRAKSAHPR